MDTHESPDIWLPDSDVRYDLVVVGSGYQSFEGALVQTVLIDFSTFQVVGESEGTMELEAFEVVISGLLEPGKSYAVAILIDKDADGLCTVASPDLGGEGFVSNVAGDATVRLDYADAISPDTVFCDLFPNSGPHGLEVVGSGFENQQGKEMFFALGKLPNWELQATEVVVIPSTGLLLHRSRVLLDSLTSYEMVAYLDTNGDRSCDQSEPQWVVPLASPRSEDVSVELAFPASDAATTCSRFGGPYAFSVTITGVDTMELAEALVNVTSDIISEQGNFFLFDNTSTAQFDGFLEPEIYYDYCICLRRGGGPCGFSGTAPTWTGTIGTVASDVHITHSISTGTTQGCL